jgi:hypothetical protein
VVDAHDSLLAAEATGVSISLDRRLNVASLRYFAGDGPFAERVQATLCMPLPEPLRATRSVVEGVESVMAWRSPTETLLLCTDETLLKKLEAEVAPLRDGCLIVQTGGIHVLRASGARVAELFARLGGQGVLPQLGGASRSRLAEIAVLALQVQPGETLLAVERVYTEHLMEWIRVSAADLHLI